MNVVSVSHIVSNSENLIPANISDICEYFNLPLFRYEDKIYDPYTKYMGSILPGKRIV